MKKIIKIAGVSVAGLIIVGLTIAAIMLQDQRQSLQTRIGAIYDKSLQELTIDIESLKTKLYKLEAANSAEQRTMLLMDVWRQTGAAQSSIAALPVSYQNTSALTQFVNRTGDYCYYLSQKISVGEDLTDEDLSQLKELASSCSDIRQCLDEGGNEFAFSADVYISEGDGNLNFSNQEYPRLQYDGPFSESTEDKAPEGLGEEEVDETAAKKAAAEFLGVEQDTLSDATMVNGKIVCFGFEGEMNGASISIYITKQGGNVLWYMCSRKLGISAVPTDRKYMELTKVAQEFVQDKGYGQTEPSYAQFYDGMAIINLAPVEDDVVLYPDLIKVWVDISRLEVTGMDANNYLMSHKSRDLDEPLLTKEEAQEYVAANMSITEVRLALIPLPSGVEKLCYEFTGTVGENDFIIYINAQTGAEEDILMIQHTNEGTLVM